jgi:DNA-binding protein HU-beta
MNKTDLITDLSAELGVSKKVAKDTINMLFEKIVDGMMSEGKVTIVDFGSFLALQKPARTARNPKTGESVEVPARVVPRFRASKTLKERVKDSALAE